MTLLTLKKLQTSRGLGTILWFLSLSIIFCVFANLFIYKSVHAWCDNISLSEVGMFQNSCVSRNYDSLPNSIKLAITADDYRELAKNCMGGNANGFDFKIREGGCADAAASCLTHAVNVNVCNKDVLASMTRSGIWGQDNGGCNGGRLTSDATDNCTVLARANFAAVEEEAQKAKDLAQLNCTIPTTASTEEAKTIAREACSRAIEACEQPAINDNGTLKDGNAYGNFQNCLKEGLYGTANNAQDCTGRGGSWDGQNCSPPTVEENADGSTNTANQQAEDTLAGNVGDKPQSKCTVKTDSNPDGKEIKTNIINCTETSPDQIFGEILRTGIQALSVLVGIAAVGGIAWASVKYAKAEDNDGDVKEAKDLIRNVIIGLLFYVLMIAIVNWLVPGGVIG